MAHLSFPLAGFLVICAAHITAPILIPTFGCGNVAKTNQSVKKICQLCPFYNINISIYTLTIRQPHLVIVTFV